MQHIAHSLEIIVPIIFVLFFGYFAQKSRAFGKSDDAITVINELALKFALPPALFVGTVTVSRSDLIRESSLFLALAAVMVGTYFLGALVSTYVFKRNLTQASITGLAVSCSSGAFYGPAVLDSIYGAQGNIAVSMFAIAFNVFVMPLAAIVINVSLSNQSSQQQSLAKLIGSSFYSSVFKTPFVWAPLLACVFVIADIKMPSMLINSFDLIGKATAGVAVFVAGMTIATHTFKLSTEVITISVLKNIIAPLLFFGIGIYGIGMSRESVSFNEGLLLSALPTAPLVVLLATKYNQLQQESSSILAVSTISMLITLTFFVSMVAP